MSAAGKLVPGSKGNSPSVQWTNASDHRFHWRPKGAVYASPETRVAVRTTGTDAIATDATIEITSVIRRRRTAVTPVGTLSDSTSNSGRSNVATSISFNRTRLAERTAIPSPIAHSLPSV